MEKKFSKGEWSRKTTKEYSDIYCNGTTIATYWNHMRNEEELEANAKLAAAAPELIEALEKIKSMCDGNKDNENNIWHIANKAINKATE